jgi:hypothetical protein
MPIFHVINIAIQDMGIPCRRCKIVPKLYARRLKNIFYRNFRLSRNKLIAY